MTDKPVIAIIDDDEFVRLSMSSLVRSYGYNALAYGSALEFLENIASSEPDCILSDIHMPVMTGDQLQERLLASGRCLPIIFMTAYPTKVVEDKVMAAGALGCLTKPADGEEVIGFIRRAVGPAETIAR